MQNIGIWLLGGLIVCAQGCSTDSLKRTGYETLRNIEDQRCLKDLSSECPERETYDEYQRKTEDLKTSE